MYGPFAHGGYQSLMRFCYTRGALECYLTCTRCPSRPCISLSFAQTSGTIFKASSKSAMMSAMFSVPTDT